MRFTMVGTLSMPKASEKFSPYDVTEYDSGWINRSFKFNAICGDNRHMLTIRGGCFSDGHGNVYLYSKDKTDEHGNRIKGEPFTIPFKDRFTSPKLADVAEFKKYIVDLEKPGRRHTLENLLNKKSLTAEDYNSVGLTIEDDLKMALSASKKMRHEFVSEWDFAEFMHNLIESNKYTDAKFRIIGDIEYQYSEKNDQFYSNYVPKRIYLASGQTEPISTATVSFLFNKTSLNDLSEQDDHKFYVNGYTFEYDRNRKENIPVPISIAVPVPDKSDEEGYAKAMYIKSKFTVEDETYKELCIDIDLLNGAQKMPLTEDMLSDEQKSDLKYGLITMSDIMAEMGQVYGDNIREFRFAKIARQSAKTGRQDTIYVPDDMKLKVKSSIDLNSMDTKTDDDFDLFGDLPF